MEGKNIQNSILFKNIEKKYRSLKVFCSYIFQLKY